jgi:hypothetical protein
MAFDAFERTNEMQPFAFLEIKAPPSGPVNGES